MCTYLRTVVTAIKRFVKSVPLSVRYWHVSYTAKFICNHPDRNPAHIRTVRKSRTVAEALV